MVQPEGIAYREGSLPHLKGFGHSEGGGAERARRSFDPESSRVCRVGPLALQRDVRKEITAPALCANWDLLEHCDVLVRVDARERRPVHLGLAVLSCYRDLCRARGSNHVEVGHNVSLGLAVWRLAFSISGHGFLGVWRGGVRVWGAPCHPRRCPGQGKWCRV